MTTGICWVCGLLLMRRHTSMPSIPGIITSSSTMSGLVRCTASSASTPFMAVTTSKYSAASFASSKPHIGQNIVDDENAGCHSGFFR